MDGQLEGQSCKRGEIVDQANCSAAYTLRAGSSGNAGSGRSKHIRTCGSGKSVVPHAQVTSHPKREEKFGFAFISPLTRHYSQSVVFSAFSTDSRYTHRFATVSKPCRTLSIRVPRWLMPLFTSLRRWAWVFAQFFRFFNWFLIWKAFW